jgi:hypothetical protein
LRIPAVRRLRWPLSLYFRLRLLLMLRRLLLGSGLLMMLRRRLLLGRRLLMMLRGLLLSGRSLVFRLLLFFLFFLIALATQSDGACHQQGQTGCGDSKGRK